MKILLLGGTGLAGAALKREILNRGMQIRCLARTGADIDYDLSNPAGLDAIFKEESPDLIINAAGKVNIKQCEENYAATALINTNLCRILDIWAVKSSRKWVHISTDHFFCTGDGAAHTERDTVQIANAYAKQKFEGEKLALKNPNTLVVRTSILGLRKKANQPSFCESVIAKIKNQEPITLFHDAWTSSIDTQTFSRAIIDLVEKKACGLINIGSSEVFTKAELIRQMARHLNIELADSAKGSVKDLRPVRANCLGLDVSLAQNILGYTFPSLSQVISSVLDKNSV